MKVLVIGAGGAGKAAAAAAVEAGMQTSIWNRTSSRAIEFADHLHQYDPHGLGSVTRIIGTSSVPLKLMSGRITHSRTAIRHHSLHPSRSIHIRPYIPPYESRMLLSDTAGYRARHTLRQDRHRSQLQRPGSGRHPLPPLYLRPHLAPPPGHRHIPHRPRTIPPVILAAVLATTAPDHGKCCRCERGMTDIPIRSWESAAAGLLVEAQFGMAVGGAAEQY